MYKIFAFLTVFYQFLFPQMSEMPPTQIAEDASSVQQEEWKALKSEVSVSFANSNIRYPQNNVPKISFQKQWSVMAWKGEKVHTQLLVWTKKDINQVSFKLTDLVNSRGNRIAKENIRASFVRYVMTDQYMPGCPKHRINQYDSAWAEDIIDVIDSLPMKSNTVQPVWLSIKVPSDISAGNYAGAIIINAEKKYKLDILVRVLRHTLPPPEKWSFDLDLWQHPASVARVHQLPLWSAEHFEKMRPYFEMLAKAGQKNITTSIINEPWNHQTFDDFPSLIKWVKKKNGAWFYDYSLFDKYVSFVMDCGIKERINCYTMIPWELSFKYYDEETEKDTVVRFETKSAEYKMFWSNMLKDFTKHLKEKKWFSMTSISVDERPLEDMKIAIGILKEIDADWKIALAGDYHPIIEEEIFDYSIASKSTFSDKILTERKKLGKPSTFYTCCAEEFPNGYTFSSPADHVWIGWYAAAHGFTGYLRWAFNSWTKNPLADSRYTAWPAGDTFQIYPGPRSSIRFEKLIEGIQDFEKIRILKSIYVKGGHQKELDQLMKLLDTFQIESLKHTPSLNTVIKAKQSIDKLYNAPLI